MSAQPKIAITPEEYLTFERQADEKHEFVEGIIYAMAGASRSHVIIVSNLVISLGVQFKSRNCNVYANDMRVKVNQADYTYPDVIAVCGESKIEDEQFDTLLNPTVIIEVLSKSTERYDKSKKADLYRNLETVQDYILVAQNQCYIEHYQRQNQNQWLLTILDEMTQILELKSINAEILVQDIYDKVLMNLEAIN